MSMFLSNPLSKPIDSCFRLLYDAAIKALMPLDRDALIQHPQDTTRGD